MVMMTTVCDTHYRSHAMNLRSNKVDTTSTTGNKTVETKLQEEIHYEDVIINKYVDKKFKKKPIFIILLL